MQWSIRMGSWVSDKLTIVSILLAISVVMNIYHWRDAGELRDIARIACDNGLADPGTCSTLRLN